MNFKKGKLYSLSNALWGDNIYKIGNTGQSMKKRLSTIHTSLYINCEIVYETTDLYCCKYWEKVIENILVPYRVNPKREFYRIDKEDIKILFDSINEFNKILDTSEKLFQYIQENDPEYLNKKIYCKSTSSSSNDKPNRKKRKGIWIDTSY